MSTPMPRPKLLWLTVVTSLGYVVLWPALFFGCAGTLRWLEGWLFNGWFVLGCVALIAWLYVRDPALLAERYRRNGSGGQSRQDQVIVYALLIDFLAWFTLMPLDAARFHWTPRLPLPVELLLGAATLAPASFLSFRAFKDNTFLSPLVRAQHEREQHVVSTGVYGFVRHPMYLGATLLFVGGPLLLSSAAGLVAGVAGIGILVYRIGGEEAVLVRELRGYDDYRGKVRFRLIPGVW